MWYDTFDSAFWLTSLGIFAGVLTLAIKSCLSSKCSQVSCCGIRCIRDVELEEREHEFDTINRVPTET